MAQTENQISIEKPQTTICDLIDDVLRETFSQFNLEELNVMADVCTTFRRVAQLEFASRYKKIILTEHGKEIVENSNRELFIGHSHWMSFIRKFGCAMTSILMDKFDEDSTLDIHFPLAAIAEYCSESLMEIKLVCVIWTNEMISQWQPLLSRLRKLSLLECKFKSAADASRLLSYCIALDSLTVQWTKWNFLASHVALPQLKSLDLFSNFIPDASTLEHLLALNPQLEEVKLPFNPSHRMVKMVSRYVPNIGEIKMSYKNGVTVDWNKFKNLKSLDLCFHTGRVIPVLEAAAEADIPLERLAVENTFGQASMPTRSFIQQISKFKRLREFELKFIEDLAFYDILTIVRNLPDLSKLSVRSTNLPFAGIPEIIKCGPKLQSMTYGTGDIDDILFMEIRDAVVQHSEYRPFHLKLHPICYKELRVAEHLLKDNSHILLLEQSTDSISIDLSIDLDLWSFITSVQFFSSIAFSAVQRIFRSRNS